MYDSKKYYGFIVRGDLKSAVEYVKEFPLQRRRYKRYVNLLCSVKPHRFCTDKVVNEICNIYAKYWNSVFWLLNEGNEAERTLLDDLNAFISDGVYADIDSAEEKLKILVENRGFHFQGGMTQGYWGPYIWKKTNRKIYSVKLPHAFERYPLDMMTGFVCCSWMDYISLGRIGTGGWAGDDGTLACVKKRYFGYMHTSRFKVNFLKHEAQHAFDKRSNPDITSVQLEYRAKLVQIIYGKNLRAFAGFLSEADGSKEENSHAYASNLLVSNLTKLVFNEEYVNDLDRWKKEQNKIKSAALKLLDA